MENILVTRLRNKNVEIWKELENWDVTVFSETWVEEKSLSREFIWKAQWAVREKKKRRAMGDMIGEIR